MLEDSFEVGFVVQGGEDFGDVFDVVLGVDVVLIRMFGFIFLDVYYYGFGEYVFF